MNLDLIFFSQCFINAIIETLITLLFTLAFTKHKIYNILSAIVKCVCYALASTIITYVSIDNLFFRILPFIAIIIFICAITGENIIHSTYLTMISYICIIITQFAVVILFRFTATMQDSFVVQLFANITSLIITLVITRVVPLHHIYDFIIRKDIAFRFFLGNTFVITFLAAYLMVVHLPHFIFYFLIIMVVLALMVFVNIELLRSRVIVDKQRSIIDSYNKYLPIVDELIEQVRSRQHGYDNNIQSLSALSLICTDYEALKTELLKNIDYMSSSDLPVFLLKFNLKLLSGLFFQKYSVAQKAGINMEFTIKNYNIQSKAPEYIIVEAVGILMDNAIEASSQNNTIYITIDCIDDKFHFDIMNIGPTYTSELHQKLFKRGYSTKTKSDHERGLGLPQLLELSNKYNGRLEVGNRKRDEQQYLFFTINI